TASPPERLMYRIAIVTPDLEHDWASLKLLEAAGKLACGDAVNPLSLEMRVGGVPCVLADSRPADAYDAYILRALNKHGEIDYQFDVFELLIEKGIPVVNSPSSLSLAESKAQTTYALRRAGLPVPRTFVTQDLGAAAEAVRAFGTSVIKPLYGSSGIGIEKLDPTMTDDLLPDFLKTYGAVYVQEYVPNEGRDIRAFVVGDRIAAAVYRVAQEGDWKTNVFQGSTCEPCELSPTLRDLCVEATRVLGLTYTGVDVLEGPSGPVILELNGTPSWYGLCEATGRDVALDLVGHVLHILEDGQYVDRQAAA
ncbi:MAG: RimK family alpha-L-glutamate ligase, partial [Armatimonadetes bacterium]|nr:RimK family alpha-L-glutamate ligase [Armatimonadota bacterium]